MLPCTPGWMLSVGWGHCELSRDTFATNTFVRLLPVAETGMNKDLGGQGQGEEAQPASGEEGGSGAAEGSGSVGGATQQLLDSATKTVEGLKAGASKVLDSAKGFVGKLFGGDKKQVSKDL